MGINAMALTELAERLIKAGYSDCTFSSFEFYPVMTEEFPEVRELTETEEGIVISMMDVLIG